MFKAISWGQYAGWLSLALLAYYAYVGLAYYRVELLGLLKNKGKAPSSVPAQEVAPPALGSSGKKSLIAKAALAVPVTPDEEARHEEDGVGEELSVEATHQQEQPTDEQVERVADLPPFELPSVEVNEGYNYENDDEISFVNDNLITFTEHGGSNSFQDTESGVESAGDDFYLGSTVGIAQLGDYLSSAAEGQITPTQLVEQEPGLANTDLLLAFFQNSTKNAQRATAHLYEGVAEPALD
ncbi:hypothetical protein GO988_22400 [Hymenobacter sp. HMF4947]|uniref:Uncharacterized protein n=1 Tax=Hymenobacter ginkgonis TaxID=2682976 RepID=A0A7K1TL52_9BACT|nr:hypothetical protein [Hymenobacter ginkgonis]MVN79092.1 hypothetical protein [Hymenobacter ginkgonis]